MPTASTLPTGDPLALAVATALWVGDVEALERLLADHPGLASMRLGTEGPDGVSRSLLHVVTDWPGHFPRVAESIAVLVGAGADVHARFHGPHEETPLHWAASTDDVVALDALLDAGADLEAPGAVIAGGTPLQDARSFGSWAAAARLVERGATVDVHDAAALGLTDRLEHDLALPDAPTGADLDLLLWLACHAGRLPAAQLLHEHGADIDVVPPWASQTALDAAGGSGNHALVTWLHSRGARLHDQLPGGCAAP